MRHLAFAIPGDIETPTGGYAYDRHIIAGLRKLKWKVDVIALGNGFPFPEMDVRNGAMQKLNALRVAEALYLIASAPEIALQR